MSDLCKDDDAQRRDMEREIYKRCDEEDMNPLNSKTEPVAKLHCSDGLGEQINNVHFSSKTDLHATPQEFFDTLDRVI